MKDLNQVTIIGLGLLGGAISLTVLLSFTHVKVVSYSHRASTRDKAGRLAVASEVVDDICQSVSNQLQN
jgi:prephenate dehydrogenase